MYTHIYQNSYVAFILAFVLLCIIFYFLQIGYTTQIVNGKVVRKFGWKYPLAIALFIWIIWHFYLYPPSDVSFTNSDSSSTIKNSTSPRQSKLADQKIDMTNWN